MLSRRALQQGSGGLVLAGGGTVAYAFSVEPGLRLDVTSYRLTPTGWPSELRLRCAVVADLMAVRTGRKGHHGLDDLDGALAQVTDDAPVILLAQEPYIFGKVPSRVALTLCGHTHGGQVDLPVLSDG